MSAPPQPGGLWFRKWTTTSPVLRLVCFPHAGGTAGFFRDWASRIPHRTELWAVQYPGRENRIAEPFITDMHVLAERIADQLRPFLDLPTVLFGHSMGAAVSCEVLRRLTGTDASDAVRHMVVSGCAAPHRIRPLPDQAGAHLLDDDELVTLLKQLDDGDLAVLDDPVMRSVVLPPIRNDYALIQSYVGRPHPVLRTDITAFTGRQDTAAGVDDVRAWAEVTHGSVRFCSFSGGHFYLTRQRDKVVQALNEVLNP